MLDYHTTCKQQTQDFRNETHADGELRNSHNKRECCKFHSQHIQFHSRLSRVFVLTVHNTPISQPIKSKISKC